MPDAGSLWGKLRRTNRLAESYYLKNFCDADLSRPLTQALQRSVRAAIPALFATRERETWQAATTKNDILCESGESYS
jgi:hypothetical protein